MSMRHMRHMPAAVVAVVTSVIVLAAANGAVGGGAAPAWAATQQPAHPAAVGVLAAPARTASATSIVSKVVLPETSIDGPALGSVTGTFEGQSTNESALAWTGTDAAHHLNLQFTSSFPSFPTSAAKTVLGDTAFGGPALAFIGFPQLAWTGTDAAHRPNVARFAMQ